ncbi:MAG TPA: homocysteine S-methyltransferase family protein, partial [Candidatus Glassbacteria bacterium]|nr:homocysteine S-methyltransferase family protein [Candidatus Glassbacteria bacterium]
AGSDIIITNTFGANPVKLAHYGAAERVEEINREAALLARQAAGAEVLVAGDIGPSGEILEQWGGSLEAGKAAVAFERQVRGLAEGGVDLVALETFMDLEELLLALAAVRKLTSLPVLASLTFGRSAQGMRTMWGIAPEAAARRLEEEGADAVGSNCGMGSRDMLSVAGEMAAATRLPVAAQPNAGLPEVSGGRTVFPETAEQMAELAGEFRKAGVKILGGCCGSTPEYIAGAKKKLGL